jgi:hypothetical protein
MNMLSTELPCFSPETLRNAQCRFRLPAAIAAIAINDCESLASAALLTAA